MIISYDGGKRNTYTIFNLYDNAAYRVRKMVNEKKKKKKKTIMENRKNSTVRFHRKLRKDKLEMKTKEKNAGKNTE